MNLKNFQLVSKTFYKYLLISIGILVFILYSLFLFHNSARADITIGLVGYWNFDEGSGTTAADSSGNNNTGTLTNGPTWTTGKIGQALNFDNIDDNVSIGKDLLGISSSTIAAWIYAKGYGEGGYGNVVANGYTSFALVGWDAKLYFTSDNSSHQTVSASNSLPLNQWVFVVVTRTKTGITNFYINGALNGAPNQNSGTPFTIYNSTIIGNSISGNSTFDGLIDEVRIYNRVLSSTEISELYNYSGGGTPTPTPSPSSTPSPTPSQSGTPSPSPPPDTTPPVRSSGSPSGTLPTGTTQTTLSLSTNENAFCKYSTLANTTYSSITNTFSTTGGTSHSATITGLSNGNTYNYYIRCQDTSNNANPDDYIIAFSITSPGGGKIINAATCSRADVSVAVAAASTGDTIIVPAGCSASYSSPVNINKAITICGGGTCSSTTRGGNNTTIIAASTSVVFGIHLTSGTARISNFSFTGTGGYNSNNNLDDGIIVVSGTGGVGIFDYVRIDHCKFSSRGGDHADIIVGEFWDLPTTPKMLIDNCIHTSAVSIPYFLKVIGPNDAWQLPDDYGTDKFIFLEDNSITYTDHGCATDADEGTARLVVRHNILDCAPICWHDPNTGPRGFRLAEIYENTYLGNCTNVVNNIVPLNSRGGSGLYYNNTITGAYYANFAWEIKRLTDSQWYGSGNTCGAMTKVCSNTTYGIWGSCANYPGTPCTGSWDCPSGSCLTSCTTDVQCGTGNFCVYIDGNTDASGYPCRDQSGRGQDDPVTHENTSDPVYIWNNTFNGAPLKVTGMGTYIVEGRDFCNYNPNTACGSKTAWSYTAYTYPHPLAVASGTPDTTPPAAPTGVAVN